MEATCRSFLWTWKATLSKSALVAWEKICLPRCAGGLNLINLRIWNQAAMCKLLWALSLQQEKLSITWIHTYYIKQQDWSTMEVPKQASWMVKKISNMRKHWTNTLNQHQHLRRGKLLINDTYKLLRGPVANVSWRGLICHNATCPKHIFIQWLALLGRMRTKDLLLSWRMEVTSCCVLCDAHSETQQYLFFECEYSQYI